LQPQFFPAPFPIVFVVISDAIPDGTGMGEYVPCKDTKYVPLDQAMVSSPPKAAPALMVRDLNGPFKSQTLFAFVPNNPAPMLAP
jgi:hypothetical protein